MTKKEFNRIINQAGISDMEHALNLMAIAFNKLADDDMYEYPSLSKEERKNAMTIHRELEQLGFYK